MVGDFAEDSQATGIGGDQGNNDSPNSGAVYVFRRHGSSWTQEAYIKGSTVDAYDHFGDSVAISGDTLAVGAQAEDSQATGVGGDETDNASTNSGAVFIFRRDGTSWTQEAYVKASNTSTGDLFGTSVSISGDTLAVGARREDSGNAPDSGAVYVFQRSGMTWTQEAHLKASNPGSSDSFGVDVALFGDTLAVGAQDEGSSATGVNGEQEDDESLQSGAAYVFRRDEDAWIQEAYVKASNTDAGDQFGRRVALFDDTLVVAAHAEDSEAIGVNNDASSNSALTSGAAYVFRRNGTTWAQEAYVKASNTDGGDNFGVSLALSNNLLAVGAHGENSNATGVGGNEGDNGAPDSGAAYLFRREGTSWTQEAYLKASNTDAGDHYGFDVALSGDALAVGARDEASAATGVDGEQGDNSLPEAGAFYLYQ